MPIDDVAHAPSAWTLLTTAAAFALDTPLPRVLLRQVLQGADAPGLALGAFVCQFGPELLESASYHDILAFDLDMLTHKRRSGHVDRIPTTTLGL